MEDVHPVRSCVLMSSHVGLLVMSGRLQLGDAVAELRLGNGEQRHSEESVRK